MKIDDLDKNTQIKELKKILKELTELRDSMGGCKKKRRYRRLCKCRSNKGKNDERYCKKNCEQYRYCLNSNKYDKNCENAPRDCLTRCKIPPPNSECTTGSGPGEGGCPGGYICIDPGALCDNKCVPVGSKVEPCCTIS